MSEDNWANQILDRWFASDAWEEISADAFEGDKDSIELMEEVNEQLGSLIFHLENQTGPERLAYELEYFVKLCDDFGVA